MEARRRESGGGGLFIEEKSANRLAGRLLMLLKVIAFAKKQIHAVQLSVCV